MVKRCKATRNLTPSLSPFLSLETPVDAVDVFQTLVFSFRERKVPTNGTRP